MSPSASRPSQPTAAHCSSVSGSVAIIEEFMGSQVRRSPFSAAVNPSVQRRTYGARTVPYGVTHRSGTRVTSIAREGERLTVKTDTESETLTADAVIVAAGSWSGLIDASPAPAPPVRPVRGQLLHLAWTTAETVIQVHGPGPFVITYVNPADDPSRSQ